MKQRNETLPLLQHTVHDTVENPTKRRQLVVGTIAFSLVLVLLCGLTLPMRPFKRFYESGIDAADRTKWILQEKLQSVLHQKQFFSGIVRVHRQQQLMLSRTDGFADEADKIRMHEDATFPIAPLHLELMLAAAVVRSGGFQTNQSIVRKEELNTQTLQESLKNISRPQAMEMIQENVMKPLGLNHSDASTVMESYLHASSIHSQQCPQQTHNTNTTLYASLEAMERVFRSLFQHPSPLLTSKSIEMLTTWWHHTTSSFCDQTQCFTVCVGMNTSASVVVSAMSNVQIQPSTLEFMNHLVQTLLVSS